MEEDQKVHKQHNKPHSGRKADKRKQQSQKESGDNAQKRNPKAFAIQKVHKLNRSFRRSQDVKSKKHHIPVISRAPVVPPPVVVAIVGPPKVGKSTLMQGIIKHYTKQRIANIKGPVTLVSGKQRRLTLMECNNDLTSMIDVAKVADLVLLLIDASFGFEMETFEFLNICQVHGFPKIMGVLTHLDLIKKASAAKKTKNELKKRFWAELYKGAKLFYLSGLVYNEYRRNEILNLCRFISVMKFRPLSWKQSHPYVLADRMEDITDPALLANDPKCDRVVTLYGYVRGTHLRRNMSVHVAGCGDYQLRDVTYLPDPCPLPDRGEKSTRMKLTSQERVVFAPMSGVGGIVYDKDAVYIDVEGEQYAKDDTSSPAVMMSSLTESFKTLDKKMKESEVAMLSGGIPVQESHHPQDDGRIRRKVTFDDANPSLHMKDSSDVDSDVTLEEENAINYEESDISSGEEIEVNEQPCSDGNDESDNHKSSSSLTWKKDLRVKAEKNFLNRRQSSLNLQRLVYGTPNSSSNGDEGEKVVGGLFKISRKDETDASGGVDISRAPATVRRDWLNDDDARLTISDCFVTGNWSEHEDAAALLEQDDAMFGDFEDLEKEEDDEGIEEDAVDGGEEDGDESNTTTELKEENEATTRKEKKKKLREAFNRDYDLKKTLGQDEPTLFDNVKEQLEEQAQLNRAEFEGMDEATRAQYEGFRPGLYVRMELQRVPCEFVLNFDPIHPVVVGGLLSIETNMGYLRARVKRHRWYKRILKSRDPLIISAGWRRYQTLPMYYMEDHNLRQRMLKYTPEHMHCWAIFYGPITPQGAGFLCVQELAGRSSNFQVAATGTILESDCSTRLVKKLKLVGYPYKIFRNTSYIKGMFNSALEVAKFEGVSIQTVSGIRGRVKKAVNATKNQECAGPPGSFRALFEDKLVKSDIVFCKTWYPVTVPKLYHPVNNLLQADKCQWEGMRTVGRLRFERKLKPPVNKDSLYKPIVRPPVTAPRELKIPRTLEKELPFKSKQAFLRNQSATPLNEREKLMQRVVVKEKKDKQLDALLTSLRAMKKDKKEKLTVEKKKKMAEREKKRKDAQIKKLLLQKESKKKLYKKLSRRTKR